MKIRIAEDRDAAAMLDIYAPYVRETGITFEYEAPSLHEFKCRMRKVLEWYPWLVAETEDCIAGYAYAGAFHERAAYRWCAETSVYVKQDMRRNGIGKNLYSALEQYLRLQGIVNLYAYIADTQKEDAYLPKGSVPFHRQLGFIEAAMFRQCGYKFNQWYDLICMEKQIGAHREDQPGIRSFRQIREEGLKQTKGDFP